MRDKLLKAPYPWAGGKSTVAAKIWQRFGDVPNLIDPFMGSCALLLGRPPNHKGRVETVNDADGMVCNFWRAVKSAPNEVAKWADWPVFESCLHARHVWLRKRKIDLTKKLEGDPDYYDAKIAGWWCWGQCLWISGAWCNLGTTGPWLVEEGKLVRRPKQKGTPRQIPLLSCSNGISREMPELGQSGKGVNKLSVLRQRPDLGQMGKGVNRPMVKNHLTEWMMALANRFARVRVICGDWTRVLGESVTMKFKEQVAVFLDPPYSTDLRDPGLYSGDRDAKNLSFEVREWALAHGDDKRYRIALCGYEGEHKMPPNWEVFFWKAQGGMANIGKARGKENRHKERIWFSPHCLKKTGFGFTV